MASDMTDNLEAERRLKARDELFWQEQERKIQGALGQPCCTLSGISAGLIKMSGHFAVVVHGEDECASCFRHIGPSTVNFFCTGLTEREFVTGETAEPLRRCLRLVAAEVAPDAIFVLGACPVEVIGDRFETVVAAVGLEYPDIPMIAMHTSGLKVGSQSAMLDWMFSTLASLPVRPPSDDGWFRQLGYVGYGLYSAAVDGDAPQLDTLLRHVAVAPVVPERDTCINLIGAPKRSAGSGQFPEYERIAAAAGLRVLSNYPHAASLDKWRAVKFARASFVVDRSLYPKFIGVLEAAGQDVVEVPLPTGVAQTETFYRAIGKVTGNEAQIEAAIAEPRDRAAALLEKFRARYGGLKVALGMRMVNNYEADQVAFHGLGDYLALAEFGFDVTVLVQGPPDKHEKFQKMFDNRGIRFPFEMFADPWMLSDHLSGGRFDVAYLADHCRPEARKAGVPMIAGRDLAAWFEGVGDNVQHVERTLSQALKRGGVA